MKLHPSLVVTLHDLYHRKEGDSYILGNPETGEFMFVTAAELRAVELLRKKLTLQQASELLAAENEVVHFTQLLHALKEHGFIHKLGNRVLSPKHEPLHDLRLQDAGFLGGKAARFFFVLLSVFGVATLLFFNTIPSFFIFFYQEKLTITLFSTILVAWFIVALRQFFKHAAARSLGVQSRFGFANVYHAFIPKTFYAKVTDQQHHYILGMSLLSLTAFASLSLLLGTFLQYPFNEFWMFVFTIAFIEILAECLLFMETDLAKFITLQMNVYKLNRQTARALKEDFNLLFKGSHKPSHHAITRYSFFYLASIVLGVLLFAAYILPSVLYFLLLAFKRFNPSDPLFVDAFIALSFFSFDLLLYGFALLRHHPLHHNDLFVNVSLLGVTVASYILAAVGVSWFMHTNDFLLAVTLTFALGVILALLFEHAVRYAHPFTEHHQLFEGAMLPVLAACIPISILFTVEYTASLYIFAIVLGVGMLSAVAASHLRQPHH